jgi:alcohol dehydrogenase class IV
VRFEFSTAARVLVGRGVRHEAANAIAREGGERRGFTGRALLVTGADADRAGWLRERLHDRQVASELFRVEKEPRVEDACRGAEQARAKDCDFVIGCGGGAALDGAKAIAALMTNPGDPLDYLEVVGRGLPLVAPPAPFIAVPTTAGTGSEVTKNAVLAVPEERVKVSLRSDSMLPRLAVVDSELTHSAPPEVTASTGLDALTHLIEAYLSRQASPATDGLCAEGIRAASGALRQAFRDGEDATAREQMSRASLFGGMALANAKLGAVHGFAGPAGGMFDAPHGCLCGRFLPYVIEANLRALEERAADSPALPRFRQIASWLTGDNTASATAGVDWIQQTCAEFAVPSLSAYGVAEADLPELVAKAQRASSMQGNPIELAASELLGVARQAL